SAVTREPGRPREPLPYAHGPPSGGWYRAHCPRARPSGAATARGGDGPGVPPPYTGRCHAFRDVSEPHLPRPPSFPGLAARCPGLVGEWLSAQSEPSGTPWPDTVGTFCLALSGGV